MAADRDAGVDRLEAFCAALKSSSEQLKEQINAIEAHDHELDALQEERLDTLITTLGRLTDEIGRAETEAAQGLETVSQAGGQIGGDRLGQASSEVDRTGADFEQELDGARSTLDQDFDELGTAGFDGLETTLEEQGGEVETLGQGNDEAFTELEGDLEELQGQADEALSEAGQGLGEVEQAFEGEESSELEGDASEVAGGLAELPDELNTGCDEAAATVDTAYDTFKEDGAAAGDSLIETVRTVAQDAAEAIGEQGSTLAEDAGAAVQTLGQLGEEGGMLEAVMEAGGQTAAALTPIVEELVVAQGKVDTIDELLDAIG